MTVGRDDLTKAETVTIAAIETSVPLLVEAREIVIAFQSMIRRKRATEPTTKRLANSQLSNFLSAPRHQGCLFLDELLARGNGNGSISLGF